MRWIVDNAHTIAREFVFVNLILLVIAGFALCNATPALAANGAPDLGLVIPVGGGEENEIRVEVCYKWW